MLRVYKVSLHFPFFINCAMLVDFAQFGNVCKQSLLSLNCKVELGRCFAKFLKHLTLKP